MTDPRRSTWIRSLTGAAAVLALAYVAAVLAPGAGLSAAERIVAANPGR